MKPDFIRVQFNKIPQPVLNTARDYVEGRNLLIRYLWKAAKVSKLEIINWLKDNKIPIKDLAKYKINNSIVE